jgi:fido (protein-threonine AMPylation protein)
MGLNLKYAEGQTPLDEEEKEGLKLNSITTQHELDEFEQLNIEKAVEWALHSNFKLEKILTEKFIKDLHRKMYGDVWKWAGAFRKSDKNIGINWISILISIYLHISPY